MILICYDGSDDARAAIDHAGRMFEGQPTTVLTVWEPFMMIMARASFGLGMAGAVENPETIDAATSASAQRQAEAGAQLACDVGLDAHPRSCEQSGTVAATILGVADELAAATIVVGSRGLTGIKSLLLGSVSHALIQHADRTVVIVPSVAVAAARRSHSETSTASDTTLTHA